MQTVNNRRALRAAVTGWRRGGEQVALVPTMGNLHEGHIALVREARKRAPRVVATIFVNPFQFAPGEDLAAYPRTPQEDAARLAAAGTDLLYAPAVEEIYPHGIAGLTRVEVPGLSDLLCGASRPGHFVGVATVVAKLFNQVQPDLALFGEKDWQQLLVIRRLAADLDFPLEVVGVATVREADGLALSSRNGYLTAEERARAPALYRALCGAAERLRGGDRDLAAIAAAGAGELTAAGLVPDYFAIRRAADLTEPEAAERELVLLAAVRLGRARLIDNLPLTL